MSATGKPAKKDTEFLSTLARGLSVLRVFTKERPEMTLSEVAAATELNPAVARRCLHTLVELGYVGKEGKMFLLTPEVMSFASAFLESMNLEEIVQPHLQKVRDKTGDSASLAVYSNQEILYLVHVSTYRMVRMGAGVGTRFPAYPTSLGRVLLAFQPRERIDDYFASVELKKLTSQTVTSQSRLKTILRDVKTNAFASIQDELDYGIVSVAVPILAPDGAILAAINCSTATTRITEEKMVKSRLPQLRRAASKIESELARYPILMHSIKSASN